MEGENNVRFANFLPGEDTLYFSVNNVENIMVEFGKISDLYPVNNEDNDDIFITNSRGEEIVNVSDDFILSGQNNFIGTYYIHQQQTTLGNLEEQGVFILVE